MISGCIFSAQVFLRGTSWLFQHSVPMSQSQSPTRLICSSLSPDIKMQKLSQLSKGSEVLLWAGLRLKRLEEGEESGTLLQEMVWSLETELEKATYTTAQHPTIPHLYLHETLIEVGGQMSLLQAAI